MDEKRGLAALWWMQLSIAALALPWMYFRAKALIAATPEAESLGEGAAFGLFLGIGVSAAILAGVLYAMCLLIPLISGIATSSSQKGTSITAIIVAIPWSVVFALLVVLDGLGPLIFSLSLAGLAATSGANLHRLAKPPREEQTPPRAPQQPERV